MLSRSSFRFSGFLFPPAGAGGGGACEAGARAARAGGPAQEEELRGVLVHDPDQGPLPAGAVGDARPPLPHARGPAPLPQPAVRVRAPGPPRPALPYHAHHAPHRDPIMRHALIPRMVGHGLMASRVRGRSALWMIVFLPCACAFLPCASTLRVCLFSPCACAVHVMDVGRSQGLTGQAAHVTGRTVRARVR